jgi:hypothetical protein
MATLGGTYWVRTCGCSTKITVSDLNLAGRKRLTASPTAQKIEADAMRSHL